MKQRSQSVAHGAVREPQTLQRPIVGSSISARSIWTTRAAAASSSAAAFSIVTPATPGYCKPNQRRIDASRAAGLRLPQADRAQSVRLEEPGEDGALGLIARDRARERAEQRQAVLVDRRLHELPHVGELELLADVAQRVADGVEACEERLDRLDLQPALVGPVPQRGTAPGVERGLDLVDARHVQVGELRPDAAGVDDAIAEVASRQLDVRRERVAARARARDGPTGRR